MLLLHLLTCLTLASIARSENLVPAFPVVHSNDSKSVPNISAEAASALSRQLAEISASHHHYHHKVKKSVPNQLNLTVIESTEGNLTGDSAVLKSLKSLISSGKKKPINPGIVYQNHHERVNEEIFDDLTKFEGYSKLLSQLMHSIVNKDLGLTVMQQTVDKLAVETSSIKFESILEGITDKVCLLLSLPKTLLFTINKNLSIYPTDTGKNRRCAHHFGDNRRANSGALQAAASVKSNLYLHELL